MKFFSRVFLAPLARLIFRPKVIGRRNVPKHGGVLLASNHLAFVDSIVITLVARRSVSFMAKSEYFTGPRPARRGDRAASSAGSARFPSSAVSARPRRTRCRPASTC